MTALTYKIPTVVKLTCSNPVCRDYAEMVIHTNEGEVLACLDHIQHLAAGKQIRRLERLRVPGER